MKKREARKRALDWRTFEELVNAAKGFEVEDLPQEEAMLLEESAEELNKELTELDILTAFLDKAALDAGDAQADDYEDAVQLMTLHSAKGLEFPKVFITGHGRGPVPT